jgi:site-specific DNA-methyltransferase (adenine-specific)
MKAMDAESVDSIVTDPPYGLSFMGKDWDHGVPGVAFWLEALRVAKPGSHLLAFGGTRTFHRLAVAIEDAGWEIRDCVMWVYGSGFPKSKNVALSIDKGEGHPNRGKAIPTASTYQACDSERENKLVSNPVPPYEAKSDFARQWQGWGTALKPAWEPIIVARKPLCGTVAENVLTHGTGAINVDGCRVGTESTKRVKEGGSNQFPHEDDTWIPKTVQVGSDAGRWPANLIHDGSDELNKLFPQTGISLGGKAGNDKAYCGGFRQEYYGNTKPGFGDSGSAARFFYCAKASKSDRGDDNDHPTVKPTNLMQYLCRLVTPPGGTVLDPFMGSGSTGKGAVLEGFKFVGCEKESQYVEIARKRIESVSGLFAKEQ